MVVLIATSFFGMMIHCLIGSGRWWILQGNEAMGESRVRSEDLLDARCLAYFYGKASQACA